MADSPRSTDVLTDEVTDQMEDLRLKPDAEKAILDYMTSKSAKNVEGLRLLMGEAAGKVSDVYAQATTVNNIPGQDYDTAKDSIKNPEKYVSFVKLTIDDDKTAERILAFKEKIPHDPLQQKGKLRPDFTLNTGSRLFKLPGDMEGEILVTRDRYESQNKSNEVTFYVKKEKFETMAREAVGLPKLETPKL